MRYLVPRLIFGCGTRFSIAAETAPFGKRVVLFYAPSAERAGHLEELLCALKTFEVACMCIPSTEEPTDALADAAAQFVREARAEVVIALGGGGVLDIGKIAAALAVHDGKAADYAEGVGERTLIHPSLPFLALPTTAGTGSEMTKNGVITIPAYGKRSIRSDGMLARTAIVDPELTFTVPPATTAASGADALCQLIEGYTSRAATPLTDGIARVHIKPVFDALPRAVRDGSDRAARETLAAGAAMSGICIANAGLGLVHGIAGVLGGLCGIRHGICCGILLPYVVAENAQKGVGKYRELAELFGYSGTSCKEAGAFLAERLAELNREIGIPADFRSFAIAPEALHKVAALSAQTGGTKKNPVSFSETEIFALLKKLV